MWKKRIDGWNIIQLKISNRKFIGLFQFILKARKFLRCAGSEFDIIHCNAPKSALPVAIFKKFKFICTVHDLRCFEGRGSFLERKITKFVSKRADKILTDSYEIKKQFKKFLPEINQENSEAALREIAVELEFKAGQVFGLLREALTGQKVSPPIFDIIPILGREKVLARLEKAKKMLSELA